MPSKSGSPFSSLWMRLWRSSSLTERERYPAAFRSPRVCARLDGAAAWFAIGSDYQPDVTRVSIDRTGREHSYGLRIRDGDGGLDPAADVPARSHRDPAWLQGEHQVVQHPVGHVFVEG